MCVIIIYINLPTLDWIVLLWEQVQIEKTKKFHLKSMTLEGQKNEEDLVGGKTEDFQQMTEQETEVK